MLLWYGVSSLYWVICLGGSGESTGPCRWRLLLGCVFTAARVADCADKPANWWKNLFLMATGHMLLNATESFLGQVIRHIGAQGLDRRGPAGSCRLFLGPGLRLGACWNRLGETVKTRKK